MPNRLRLCISALLVAMPIIAGCHQPTPPVCTEHVEAPAPVDPPPGAVSPVKAEISAAETEVGIPIMLTITVERAQVRESPKMPEIRDVAVGSSGSQFNPGSESARYVYHFELTPKVQGKFVIPSMTIQAGGRFYQTDSFTITVVEPRPERVPVQVKDKDGQIASPVPGARTSSTPREPR